MSEGIAGLRAGDRLVRGSVALLATAVVAAALLAASPAAGADPIQVLPASIGATVGDTTAAWTKANGDNVAGRYEIVRDPTDGVVLELQTIGGAAGVGTQAKLMHYFSSGAYSTIDGAASLVGADPVASIPLGALVASPISASYRASTYLSLQVEIRYGADKFATIYQNGPAAATWASFSVDPTKRWTISRSLTDSAGTVLARCGASGSRACVNGEEINLADLLAGLADQDPRAISVGVNKGRDSNPANAGLVQVRDISFGGETFVFALPSPPGDPVPGSPPPPAPLLPTDPGTPPPVPSAVGWSGDPVVPPSIPAAPIAPGAAVPVTFADGTFLAFEWVDFVFYSTPAFSTSLQATATGSLSGSIPVPTSVVGGSHTLAATGFTSGIVVTAAVAVAALAPTGIDAGEIWWTAALGAAIALWGVVLVVAVRRRLRA